MPPKKKGKGKGKRKKKAPAFYTDIDDLLPFGVVRANELITTALGVEATVLGVKYKVKGDRDSGRLWVQYRGGYQCPLETQLEEHKRCPEGANIWRPVAELQQKQRKEEELHHKVEELNRKHQEMLDAKNKKNKPKKKTKPQTESATGVTTQNRPSVATKKPSVANPTASRSSVAKAPLPSSGSSLKR